MDLRPRNLVLFQDGARKYIKLIDFGTSKVLDAKNLSTCKDEVDKKNCHANLKVTVNGWFGNYQYACPEQLQGDHTSDVSQSI